jgi:nucleoside-diphosphate-sugar epimerase
MDYQECYRGKTILVTGGAGAIGSNLTRALGELGAKLVVVLDDLSSASRWNIPALHNVMFVEGSIMNEAALKRVFAELPDLIFHLAALFANQNSVDHPENDLQINGLGTLKLLQYCHLSKISRFIYASSGASFYDSNTPLPLTEECMSLHLGTPYQITKLLGELYCNYFQQQYNLATVRVRFFNSYGPGEIPGQYRNVIPNFIYWAMQGRPLPITGTGAETRDFTYVDDVVDGLLRCGSYEAAIGQEFNLASGKETCIADLALLINELVNNNAGVTYTTRRKWDTKTRRLASVEKAYQLVGYQPRTLLRDGLKATIDWFREHWEQIDFT